MQELYSILTDIQVYFVNAIQKVKPFLALLITVINYIIFPDKSYIPAAIGLGGAMIMDIITKYYALQKPHKGVWKAIKARAIRSNRLWDGTKKKLISYLVIMILCGLSMRVAPVAIVAIGFSNLVYTIMFLRECQSCAENMVDAGHDDFKWVIDILKRKQKKVLEAEDIIEKVSTCNEVQEGIVHTDIIQENTDTNEGGESNDA